MLNKRFETRKAEPLLVYLAYNRRGYPREVLVELLWYKRSQQQALAHYENYIEGWILLDRLGY